MKETIIPRHESIRKVVAALKLAAQVIETNEGEDARRMAFAAARASLAEVLEPNEAEDLVRIVSEERIECLTCKRPVRRSRSDLGMCRDHAMQERARVQSEYQRDAAPSDSEVTRKIEFISRYARKGER